MVTAFALELAARGMAQLATVLIARTLRPSGFGVFLVATTVLGIALMVVDLGMQDSAIQKFSGRDVFDQQHVPFATLRLLLAALCTVLAAALLWVLAVLDSRYTAVPIMLAGVAPSVILTNAAIQYRIRNQIPLAAATSAMSGVALGVGALVGVLAWPTPAGAAIGSAAALFLTAGGWYIRDPMPLRSPTRGDARRMARAALPFLQTGLAVALYSRGDRLVVAWALGRFDAGLYGAAYSLVYAMSLLAAAIHIVALPHLVRAWDAGAHWRRDSGRFIVALLITGACCGTVLFLASGNLISGLYGPAYVEASTLVRFLSPLVPLHFINMGLAVCLVASRREGKVAKVATVNLLLAAVLYPSLTLLTGSVGAAVGSVLVEVTGNVMLWRALRSKRTVAR